MPEVRFPNIDQSWATTMRQAYARLLTEHRDAIPNTPAERLIYAWDAVANDARELALVLYASGDPLNSVAALLVTSAGAHLELVKLRGTDDFGSGGGRLPLAAYSTGNSRSTYLAICMALIAGEIDLAHALAPLVWDPIDTEYVAPNSVLCTNQQQICAYALKHLLLGEKQQAEAQLSRSAMLPEAPGGELLMLEGLVADQPTRTLEGMARALASHARAAARKENLWVLRYFLCIPCLGLASLALRRGLITREQLPANNLYFPSDLIAI